MSSDRSNPDVFWTDEEVKELKDKWIISEDKPEDTQQPEKCPYCGKESCEDSCIPF